MNENGEGRQSAGPHPANLQWMEIRIFFLIGFCYSYSYSFFGKM